MLGDLGRDLCERAPDVIGRGNAGDPRETVVHPEVAAVGIGDAHARGRVAEERLGLRALGALARARAPSRA